MKERQRRKAEKEEREKKAATRVRNRVMFFQSIL